MADSGDLGPKSAMAVAGAKFPKVREEGEISSGDDAELPASSTAPCDSTTSADPIPISLKNSLTKNLKSGNNFGMTKMQPQIEISGNYGKNFKMKRAPFKPRSSRTLSWRKNESDDNLVISFSDDDSGSDSGKSKPTKSVRRKNINIRADTYNLPAATSQMQSEALQWASHQKIRPMSKKGFVSHAPVLSITKNCGRIPSAKKYSFVQRPVTVTRTPANQVHGHAQDASLAEHRLEDLRHQIAVRENELMVQKKSMAQRKTKNIGSHSDQSGQQTQNLDTQAANNNRAASASSVDLVPNDRPLKRAKLDEQYSGRVSDGQLQMQIPSAKSSEFSQQLTGKHSFLMDRITMGCCESDRENFIGRNDQKLCKRHNDTDKSFPTSSKALPAGSEDNEILVPTRETESSTMHDLGKPSINFSCYRGQSGGDAMPLDSGAMLDESSHLTRPTPGVESSEGLKHLSVEVGRHAPDLFRNKVSSSGTPKTGFRVPLGSSSDLFEKGSGRVRGTYDNEENANLLMFSGQSVFSGLGGVDLKSLLELEELHDKQLEEALEFRHKYEIDERHALKAYRKAQRALIDANEKCGILYRKRELLSAQIQGLLTETSSSICPPGWQDQREAVLDSIKPVPVSSIDMLCRFGHRMPAKGLVLEHLGYKSDIHCPDGAPDASYQQVKGDDSGSDQCSEPDDSTSVPKDNFAMDGVSSPAYHPNVFTDDDEENCPVNNGYAESNLASYINSENLVEATVDVHADKEGSPCSENGQDYELLEASLRSKLVARFGMRMSSKSCDMSYTKCHVDPSTGVSSKHEELPLLDQQLEGKRKIHEPDFEGIARPGGSTDQLSVQLCGDPHVFDMSFKDEVCRNTDLEDNRSLTNKSCSPTCRSIFVLPSPVLHNAFRHVKLILPGHFDGFSKFKYKDCMLGDAPHKVMADVTDAVKKREWSSMIDPVTSKTDLDMDEFTIDPFWPFCMFELRGKCNDDECPWQHVRNCTQRKSKPNNSSDNQVGRVLIAGRSNNACVHRRGLYQHLLPVPTYHIGSNLIKIDSQLSQSLLAHTIWQYWQMGFCASFPLPFSVRRILPPDAPFLQTGDGPVADYVSWNRHSMYFRSQDGSMKKFVQGLPDSEQSLELALDFFSGKFCKPDRKKALSLLSRAIEANPNSVVLWVVYLHIYYRKENGIGKDDMFFHAVQHNGFSYELWLLYINSRMHLSERLNAYNNALSILCRRTVMSDKETMHKSACVLDIFLQMIDFLCMCGKVETAIRRIYGLLPTTNAEFSGDVLLSDIFSCLIVSDRCILWVCCIYLAIYRKLPEAVVHQFEFEKELPFEIEWPSIQLAADQKDRVMELMSFAVDKMALGVHKNSDNGDRAALRSLHFLAVSHIRCVTALNGLHFPSGLLDKYIKLYPSCIELVVASARLQHYCGTDMVLGGFEEVLRNWPKETPGLQCLWNQYVEHALLNGRVDLAENLMTRWFQGFWDMKDAQFRNLGDGDGVCSLSGLLSPAISEGGSLTDSQDDIFWFLNLSLYKMLQNNLAEARLAVEKALNLATPEYYWHCVRDHAALFLLKESDSQEDISVGAILDLLHGYLGDRRSSHILEPLARRYCQNIKKPRIRQLIDDVLGPVPVDPSSINSILEVCYGPCLIPEKVGLKDLVDFVESLMEVTPANYQLALSVYRFAARNFYSSGVCSDGIMFWAGTILVNSIFQAVPVAPEPVWLEAANLLGSLEIWGISKRFHQQAISVYPFSIRLWQSFLDLAKISGNADAVLEDARERGIEICPTPD